MNWVFYLGSVSCFKTIIPDPRGHIPAPHHVHLFGGLGLRPTIFGVTGLNSELVACEAIGAALCRVCLNFLTEEG